MTTGYLISSLRLLSGWALTTLRAGLALTSIISPGLKGLGFLVALVAGLTIRLSLSRPGTVNTPGTFLPSSRWIRSERASKNWVTCLRLRPVFSARSAYVWDLLWGLAAVDPFFLLSAMVTFAPRSSGMAPRNSPAA